MRGTFFNAGSALPIGVFFSLMVAGLLATVPAAEAGPDAGAREPVAA
jgi:hypothetical protein